MYIFRPILYLDGGEMSRYRSARRVLQYLREADSNDLFFNGICLQQQENILQSYVTREANSHSEVGCFTDANILGILSPCFPFV